MEYLYIRDKFSMTAPIQLPPRLRYFALYDKSDSGKGIQNLLLSENINSMASSLRGIRLWHKVLVPGFRGAKHWESPRHPALLPAQLSALLSNLTYLGVDIPLMGEGALFSGHPTPMAQVKSLDVPGLTTSNKIRCIVGLCPGLEHLSCNLVASRQNRKALREMGQCLGSRPLRSLDCTSAGNADWAWLKEIVQKGQLEYVRLDGDEQVTAELIIDMVRECKVNRVEESNGNGKLDIIASNCRDSRQSAFPMCAYPPTIAN